MRLVAALVIPAGLNRGLPCERAQVYSIIADALVFLDDMNDRYLLNANSLNGIERIRIQERFKVASL